MMPCQNNHMIKVILKPKKEEALKRKHPWIFSGAIKRFQGKPADGDRVEVVSSFGQFLAIGHYHGGSIAVRILSFEPVEIDQSFWNNRIENAVNYRAQLILPNPQTNCYRLIHGEGDGLPGLVVDVYGDTAVLQCHSIGMHKEREAIADAILTYVEGVNAVYDKSNGALPERYAATVEDGYLKGTTSTNEVMENGLKFYVNWETGQKTGFFIDQRFNRDTLKKYVEGKKVLNAFCYSGGFSVYALAAGAAEVHSIDISKKAMEWTDQNVALNTNSENHTSITGNVMEYLKTCEEFEVMVVDPPAFAKSMAKRHNAVQGYKRLNAQAMKKLAPNGIMFTFSCSQVIDRKLFYNTIVAAAIEAGRNVRVMQHLSQPPDHPVNIFHPEGAYLKGLILQVE